MPLDPSQRAADDEDSAAGWDAPGRDDVVGGEETDPDRRDLRGEIGKYVSLASFPATAEELREVAARNGAPGAVTQALADIGEAGSFATARDLWIALGLEVKERF